MADDSTAILDGSAIDALREVEQLGRTGLVARVAGIYLRDGPDLLAAMAAASEQGDAERLRRSAHDLKSSSANLGARRVSELCAELEQRAREGHTADADERISRVRRAFEEACEALRGLPELRDADG